MKIVYLTPNGKITQDYEPPAGSTICVEFQSNVNALCFTPTVEGNVLHVTDNGELPAGTYSVNIHVTEPNGDKRCSKLKNSIVVYDDNEKTVDEFDDFPDWADGAILQGSVFYNTGGGVVQDAVLYTEQSLTTEQKTQARTNIGAGTYSKPSDGIPSADLTSNVQTSLEKADTALQEESVFVAEYGVTTLDQIQSALANGKVPVLYYDGYMYLYSTFTSASGDAYFINTTHIPTIRIARIDSSGWRGVKSMIAEITNNRTDDISTNKTSTNKYPSTKGVADYVDGIVGDINTILDDINGEVI